MEQEDEMKARIPIRKRHQGQFIFLCIVSAYLAGLAVGYWKNSNEIKKCWKADRIFKPKMPRKVSDKLYEGWMEAVKRTLSYV